MEGELALLITIQGLDDEIKSIESQIDKIPKEIISLECEIKKADVNLSKKKERLREVRKIYKLKEGNVADNEARLTKLNTQIFSVKTNEEYRAILSEIGYLKKENKGIEDEMLNLLEEEDTLKKSIALSQNDTNNFIDKKRKAIEQLKKKQEDLQAKERQKKIAFEENFNKLSDDVKNLYMKIKKARGNAVCIVSNNICTGCYANLTHQFVNELKKKDRILLCDNCGRILIYKA